MNKFLLKPNLQLCRQYLLGKVNRQQLAGVLLEVLLEGLGEQQHRLTHAELGTLDHAFLVVDKQVSTAWQNVAALLTLLAEGL